MFSPKIGIKRMIVGALLVVFAIAILVSGGSAGDQKAVYGELKWDKAAKDSVTGVTADSPVLVRVVEMYQYKERDLNNDGEISYEELRRGKGFSQQHESSIKVQGALDTYEWYKNPSFPKDFRTKAFYGDVEINDVRLDESILKPLTSFTVRDLQDTATMSYVDFKKTHKAIRLQKLPTKGGRKYGLVARTDGTYTSPGDDWRVGDLRVSYYIVDKKTLGKFTACGILEDGVLGPGKDDAPVFLYDRKVSAETVKKNYEDEQSDNKMIAIVVMIIGILLAGWGVFAFVKRKDS
ncbi:MAG: TMEM43 family protein [Anaerovoracaceae bacterium]